MGKKVGIIGAGAAGIMAAIVAAKSGWQVVLYDSNMGVGRKLLITGGGRCNLTNASVGEQVYHTQDKSFVATALRIFGQQDLVNYLEELCIPVYSTDDGWFYPLSNSASNVVHILDAALDQLGVHKVLNTKITGITLKKEGFSLSGSGKTFEVDKLIIASGGKAYPSLGSKGELFEIIGSLGHRILPVLPALAPVQADMSTIHALQGVRLDVTATLMQRGRVLDEASGNMIFTSWGMNGPAVMDISHQINLNKNNGMFLRLNFLPRQEELLKELIAKQRRKRFPIKTLLESVLPEKICGYALKQAQIREDSLLSNLTEDSLIRLLEVLKNVTVKVKGTRDFQYSQVSTGGVDVREVNPENMKSRLVDELYFAGEVLDVIGPCGGYNLQWAFTSGAIAGKLMP